MSDSDQIERELLGAHLSLCVPTRVDEYLARGGPTDTDRDRHRDWTVEALTGGFDAALRGDEHPKYGGRRAFFALIADALAVMAFLPRGVTFIGEHYHANCDCDDR